METINKYLKNNPLAIFRPFRVGEKKQKLFNVGILERWIGGQLFMEKYREI